MNNTTVSNFIKTELEKYPIGTAVAYLNNDNILKYGGKIIKFTENYFIYINETGVKYRTRYVNINEIYIESVCITKDNVFDVHSKKYRTMYPEIDVNKKSSLHH